MKKDVHNFVNNVFYDKDGYYRYQKRKKAPKDMTLWNALKPCNEDNLLTPIVLKFYDIETPEKYEIFKQNIIDFIEFYSDIGPLALQERLGYELGLEPRTEFLRELCGVMGIPLNTFTNTSM